MKKGLLFLIGLTFIAGSVYIFLQSPAPSPDSPPKTDKLEVVLGETSVLVDIADTPQARQQGLSGREELGEREGMLFVFEQAAKHAIWMKDMLISLDIIWLDEERRVIWVEENVSPASFPEAFAPESAAKYVLELPSGFVAENRIDTGMIVSWRP